MSTAIEAEGFEQYPFEEVAESESFIADVISDGVSNGLGAVTGEEMPFGRRRAPRRLSKSGAIWFGIFASVLAVVGPIGELNKGETLHAVLFFYCSATVALLAFGVVPQGEPRGSFRYLSSIVMTRADRPTADSWVHLAPTRAARPLLLVAFAAIVLGLLALSVSAAMQALGIIPRANSNATTLALSFGAVVAGLLGILGVWLLLLMIGRRLRNGSFGTRPSGVALGQTSVAVRVPGRDVEIPWTQIAGVDPKRILVKDEQEMRLIQISLNRKGPIPDRVQMLPAENYQVPTDALYTALRWYHAHPEARWELGRVEGERRLQGWCAQAVPLIR